MPRTLSSDQPETPRKTLPANTAGQLKAELPGIPLRQVVREALQRTTSQKAAATDIEISEGRLSSKLEDGSLTIKQLEKLGVRFGQRLGEECRGCYGSEDPQARLRRAIRNAQHAIDEAAEAL